MKTVLFACVQNAGRSQMAAALFNALVRADAARAISAGTRPAAHVHEEVVASLREAGIHLSEVPRRLTDDLARSADLLVTMGCGEECPVVPGVPREDWPLEDPAGQPPERVRAIREEIRARVLALLHREHWANPVEQIIAGVVASLPGTMVEPIGVMHPGADDDGLWFFTRPGRGGDVQIESSTRMLPVVIETTQHARRTVATSVLEAVEIVVRELGALPPAAGQADHWVHEHEFLGLEFDWLASDHGGRVAIVATAGAGPIPRSSLRDVESLQQAIDGLRTMKETGAAVRHDTRPLSLDDWLAMARRGIYAFDWDRGSSTYRLIASPACHHTLATVPASLAAVAARTHLNQLFRKEQGFAPAEWVLAWPEPSPS